MHVAGVKKQNENENFLTKIINQISSKTHFDTVITPLKLIRMYTINLLYNLKQKKSINDFFFKKITL